MQSREQRSIEAERSSIGGPGDTVGLAGERGVDPFELESFMGPAEGAPGIDGDIIGQNQGRAGM